MRPLEGIAEDVQNFIMSVCEERPMTYEPYVKEVYQTLYGVKESMSIGLELYST